MTLSSRLSAAAALLLFSCARALCIHSLDTPESERVVVLANLADEGSLRVARHYCEARGVPPANIIALPMSGEETIPWRDFVTQIWEPLRAELLRRDWLEAIPMDRTDAAGRRVWVVSHHSISHLVVCRGVPLRVANESTISDKPGSQIVERDKRFHVNECSVDGELSVLAQSTPTVTGFIENPLYLSEHPRRSEADQVVRVARLDGPTEADALGLVDLALQGERDGLVGRAYVDEGGIYPDGDAWFRATELVLRRLSFDTDVEGSSSLFSDTARMDGAVLYFGWYAQDLKGPFTRPGFRFQPGAVAFHLHSFSAQTLRSDRFGWCGPLIARGAAVTFGNVWEPYLHFTHRPHVFLAALAEGKTVGEAAYRALPCLSWQAVLVGDPLYRPFRRDFRDQWAKRAELSPRNAGYLTLRRLHQVEDAGLPDSAREIGLQELEQRPSLALALGVAMRLGKEAGAQRAWELLRDTVMRVELRAEDLAMLRSCVRLLEEGGELKPAAVLALEVLKPGRLPADCREEWRVEARRITQKAGMESLLE